MDFETLVLKELVSAAEDRQQPVVDWLSGWRRCGNMQTVILAGLRLEDAGEDLVNVEVNGRVTLLLTYDQVEALRKLLLASL